MWRYRYTEIMFWKIFTKSLRNPMLLLTQSFHLLLQEKKEAIQQDVGEKLQSDQHKGPTPVDKAQYASSDVQYDMEIWSFRGRIYIVIKSALTESFEYYIPHLTYAYLKI